MTTTPVPAAILLTHRILKMKVAVNRYTVDGETTEAETARDHLNALEAEYGAALLMGPAA
jgi:hypothetical protein